MDRELLSQYGRLLLGDRWQRPLSRLLSVDDRLVRRWVSGERSIPSWVLERLREVTADRIEELKNMQATDCPERMEATKNVDGAVASVIEVIEKSRPR